MATKNYMDLPNHQFNEIQLILIGTTTGTVAALNVPNYVERKKQMDAVVLNTMQPKVRSYYVHRHASRPNARPHQ